MKTCEYLIVRTVKDTGVIEGLARVRTSQKKAFDLAAEYQNAYEADRVEVVKVITEKKVKGV